MATDRSAPALLREAGLMADGPAEWGRPLRYDGPGVFLVELPAPVVSPAMDLAPVGKWLERVPDLRLDGVRPTSRDLVERLRSFWLPSQPVLLIGSTDRSVGGRLAAMAKTVPGDKKPAWTGFWLHFLRTTSDLRIWWASTGDADATALAELELLEAFAKGVPADEAGALRAGSAVLPWAVLQTRDAGRKITGISNPLLPEPEAAKAQPVTRIVELPGAEADGARDEAKRGRRPAPGRGTGKIASAAAYAAQGSPRKAAEEPILLSPEGYERLQADLAGLLSQRPDVIKRIATAREHGDLKENAEYHAAREEQGFLEGRIKAIEAKLKLARVVAPTERGQHVELGSRVRVEEDGEESTLQVVSAAEANSREGRISSVSPVGAALMGRQVGDAVTIITPGGEIRYVILEIG
jgi:transcription elongation factor GreA